MMHKGLLSITRPQSNFRDKYISLTIKDYNSGVEVVSAEIDLGVFMECLTGLAFCDCEFNIGDVGNIGKIKEFKTIEFSIPEEHLGDRKAYAVSKTAELTDEGWIADNYFGSQDSFFFAGGVTFARATFFKWADA